MASGVNWSYLKGMPVFIGVVNRLERVMTITWGFPRANFTYKNASAPAPPALLTTRKFWGARLFFWSTAEMKRAIRSAPPPVPAGTTNSTGFVGCHAGAPAAGNADSTVMPRPAVKINLSHLLISAPPQPSPQIRVGNSSGLPLRVARKKAGPWIIGTAHRLRRRLVLLQFLPEGNDARDQPLLPHIIDLRLEVVDVVVGEVREAPLSQQVVSHRLALGALLGNALAAAVEFQHAVFDLVQRPDPGLHRQLAQFVRQHRIVVPPFRAGIQRVHE